MDTTKVNTENIYIEILLEFETLDEERYAVSILNHIRFKKIMDLILEESLTSGLNEQLKTESKREFKPFP